MSGARNREVVCVRVCVCVCVCFGAGGGNGGIAGVKVNRPKFWHGNGSVCVSKSGTEGNTERMRARL